MFFLFVLTGGPGAEGLETVTELAAQARALGHRVEIFLAGDAVVDAGALAGQVPVILCEADLRRRQNQPAEISGVRHGSLFDLARQCREADRVLVFS